MNSSTTAMEWRGGPSERAGDAAPAAEEEDNAAVSIEVRCKGNCGEGE